MNLQDAIEVLANTYQSLDVVARGLPVDAEEVEKALETAQPDTTEYVCLVALQKAHPV